MLKQLHQFLYYFILQVSSQTLQQKHVNMPFFDTPHIKVQGGEGRIIVLPQLGSLDMINISLHVQILSHYHQAKLNVKQKKKNTIFWWAMRQASRQQRGPTFLFWGMESLTTQCSKMEIEIIPLHMFIKYNNNLIIIYVQTLSINF